MSKTRPLPFRAPLQRLLTRLLASCHTTLQLSSCSSSVRVSSKPPISASVRCSRALSLTCTSGGARCAKLASAMRVRSAFRASPPARPHAAACSRGAGDRSARRARRATIKESFVAFSLRSLQCCAACELSMRRSRAVRFRGRKRFSARCVFYNHARTGPCVACAQVSGIFGKFIRRTYQTPPSLASGVALGSTGSTGPRIVFF